MQHVEQPALLDDPDEEGPSREAVLALAPSRQFARDGTIFAATMAGLYRSRDRGATWERLAITAQDLPLLSLAVSPELDTDGLLLAGALEGGLLRSVDGGATWSLANLEGRQVQCAALALSPQFASDGIGFAATMSDGIFQTYNRGVNWQACNFGLLDLSVTALAIPAAFPRDETLYAATASGLFRSPNAARAWREVASPSEDAPVQCLVHIASPDGPGTLLAGTDGAGVFRSDDRGSSWRSAGTALDGTCINALALSPEPGFQHTVFALTDADLYLSSDAGEHWQHRAQAAGALCLAITPDFAQGGLVVLGLSRQGIASSPDLAIWLTAPVVEASTLT